VAWLPLSLNRNKTTLSPRNATMKYAIPYFYILTFVWLFQVSEVILFHFEIIPNFVFLGHAQFLSKQATASGNHIVPCTRSCSLANSGNSETSGLLLSWRHIDGYFISLWNIRSQFRFLPLRNSCVAYCWQFCVSIFAGYSSPTLQKWRI
jgi:hypothetical protein